MGVTRESPTYACATVSVFFDREHVACAYCPMLETYARNQCRMTGEYIIDTRYTTGWKCPLNIEIPEEIEQ